MASIVVLVFFFPTFCNCHSLYICRNKLFFMKYPGATSTSLPVAVLIILEHLVNVNGLIRVIEGFYDLSDVW